MKAGAQVVTTSNLKDFMPLPDGVEAQSPDEFLCNLFDLAPEGFTEMLREQAANLQKPPVTFGLSFLRCVTTLAPILACSPPAVPHPAVAAVTVPTGAWQRDWIRRHGGAPDTRVAVRYVQTPSVFGDLRVPADRPDVAPAASLADLGDDQLAALAHQNGFAGFTTVDGANATWHHEIDFQPTGGGTDIGRIEPAGDGRMFEHALDDSYVESWSALDRGGGFFAARVERAGRVDQLLAVAGEHFVYARARAVVLPPGDSLTELIARTHPPRDIVIAYLDCEISYGTTRGWQIEHSTLPWQQGKRLAFVDRIAIDASGRPAPRDPAAGEGWSFPVVDLALDKLRAGLDGPW